MVQCGMAPRIGQFLLTILCLLQLSLAIEASTQTVYLGYSLPPYTSKAPESLAEVTYALYEDGTHSVAVESWTPPPTAASKDVQIGITQGVKKGFTGNTILVSKDLVLDKQALLSLHLDSKSKKIWSVGITRQAAAGPSSDKPAATIVPDFQAPAPVVNKPVVLTAEGKAQEPPPEKTLFQKYWWVLLGVTFVMMSAGGGGDSK